MTLLAVLGSAVVICTCSVIVGQAIWRLAGFDGWSWLAGPVGLAALVAVAVPAVELPGAGTASAIVLLLLVLGALALRPRGVAGRDVAETALVAAAGLVVAALPFIATGRIGILGVTDNADFSAHLMLADGVRHGHDPVGLDPNWYANYPTGPHALVASLNAGLGIPLDAAFTGLLMATLALSVLAALSVLREASPVRRVVGALIAGIPYLGASFMVQAAFKEPLLGLIVIASALALPPVADGLRTRQRAILPLAALAAGAYGDYSFVGLGWLAAVGATYLAARWLIWRLDAAPSAGKQRWLPRIQMAPHWAIAPALFAAVVALSAVPQLGKAKSLGVAVKNTAGGGTSGGNIRGELPSYQVFGAWPSSDLRAPGSSLQLSRAFALLAACVAVWSAWWWWRRRRPELPAAAAATIVVYGVARVTATPYYSAKALVVAAFAVGLMSVTAVVLALPPLARLRGLGTRRIAAVAAGITFLVVVAWSSGLALRGGRVAPAQHDDQLTALRPMLRGSRTLYMGQNNYIPWELRGVKLSFPYIDIGQSQVPFDTRPDKGWTVESTFDFDNIDPQYLDRFRFALAPRTPYASQPPPNWKLAKVTRSYEVWERHGPSQPHSVLQEGGGPGAVLDCASPDGKALSEKPGTAAVRLIPAVITPNDLHRPNGSHVPIWQFHRARISTGEDAIASANLPRGRWTLSMQYVSPVPLEVTVDGKKLHAVPSLEGPGAIWRVGTFTSPGGPQVVRIHADAAHPLATFRIVLLGLLAFTPAYDRDTMVPLRQACGRYVDWYQTA